MRKLRYFVLGAVLAATAACSPAQSFHNILVRFQDLKSDMVALEASLRTGEWPADSLSRQRGGPVALGAFETPAPKATADQPDIDLRSLELTDTIVKVFRRRQGRLPQILKLQGQGTIGEGNLGYLARPTGEPVSSLEEADRKLVESENADRKIFFEEVLRQYKYTPDKIDRVGREFAAVQRAMATKGTWVQEEDGTWRKVS